MIRFGLTTVITLIALQNMTGRAETTKENVKTRLQELVNELDGRINAERDPLKSDRWWAIQSILKQSIELIDSSNEASMNLTQFEELSGFLNQTKTTFTSSGYKNSETASAKLNEGNVKSWLSSSAGLGLSVVAAFPNPVTVGAFGAVSIGSALIANDIFAPDQAEIIGNIVRKENLLQDDRGQNIDIARVRESIITEVNNLVVALKVYDKNGEYEKTANGVPEVFKNDDFIKAGDDILGGLRFFIQHNKARDQDAESVISFLRVCELYARVHQLRIGFLSMAQAVAFFSGASDQTKGEINVLLRQADANNQQLFQFLTLPDDGEIFSALAFWPQEFPFLDAFLSKYGLDPYHAHKSLSKASSNAYYIAARVTDVSFTRQFSINVVQRTCVTYNTDSTWNLKNQVCLKGNNTAIDSVLETVQERINRGCPCIEESTFILSRDAVSWSFLTPSEANESYVNIKMEKEIYEWHLKFAQGHIQGWESTDGKTGDINRKFRIVKHKDGDYSFANLMNPNLPLYAGDDQAIYEDGADFGFTKGSNYPMKWLIVPIMETCPTC